MKKKNNASFNALQSQALPTNELTKVQGGNPILSGVVACFIWWCIEPVPISGR